MVFEMELSNFKLIGCCGPEEKFAFEVCFSPKKERDSFIGCDVTISIPNLTSRISGLAFEASDLARLAEAIRTKGALEQPVADIDFLLVVRTTLAEKWVSWELEWSGVFPAHLSIGAGENVGSRLEIGGLRVARNFDGLQ